MCAKLYKMNIVDFIISEDSDLLLYNIDRYITKYNKNILYIWNWYIFQYGHDRYWYQWSVTDFKWYNNGFHITIR